MTVSELLGFNRKWSRSYKFYLLFFVMALFLFGAVLVSGMDDVWVQNKTWMVNVIDSSKQCQIDNNHSYTLMGSSYTFNKSAQLFFLVGMGFGVSYSMTKVNVLDWINSPVCTKIVRMTMAVLIYISIKLVFLWLSVDS